MNTTTTSLEAQQAVRECFFNSRPRNFAHIYHLLNNKEVYIEELDTLIGTGAVKDLSPAAKSRILFALQRVGETKQAGEFLKYCDAVIITKACQFLDLPRQIRQTERRIESIVKAHPNLTENDNHIGSKKRRKTRLHVYQTRLREMQALQLEETHTKDMPCIEFHQCESAAKEMMQSGSLSGAFAKKVRNWARTCLKLELLDMALLNASAIDLWKQLADMVHFKPSDFASSYFLSAVHNGGAGAAPSGSFPHGLVGLSKVPEQELVSAFKDLVWLYPHQVYQSYSFLRTNHESLLRQKEIALMLAKNIPLGTAVWYLEEIEDLAESNGEIPAIIGRRLKAANGVLEDGSKVGESFGKLLERILTFQARGWYEVAKELLPPARLRLSILKETWFQDNDNVGNTVDRGYTVVLGDKSDSMKPAIQSATIIATMISACFDAELIFCDESVWQSPYPKPDSVEQVLEICEKVKASGPTCLSAGLTPYYDNKRKVDRLVVVSDEADYSDEFGWCDFAELVTKYREEVNKDMELIMICIGKEGCWWMYRDLVLNSVDHKRIIIDGERPDLSKFDSLMNRIGLLSSSGGGSDLPYVQKVWGEVCGHLDRLYQKIIDSNPQVENPWVKENFPGDDLYRQIEAEFLSLDRSDLKALLEQDGYFRERLASILAYLEVWKGERE